MGNLYQHTHTYANIQREKCFCINFLPISYYDRLVDTINNNDIETDEFAVGGFTLSNAKTIHAPVIQEAFINMECTLKETQDLSGAGITAMVIGQVQHISVEKEYAQGYEQRYGKDGFMMLVPAPQDLVTGKPNQSAIATINIEKYDWKMCLWTINEPSTSNLLKLNSSRPLAVQLGRESWKRFPAFSLPDAGREHADFAL